MYRIEQSHRRNAAPGGINYKIRRDRFARPRWHRATHPGYRATVWLHRQGLNAPPIMQDDIRYLLKLTSDRKLNQWT